MIKENYPEFKERIKKVQKILKRENGVALISGNKSFPKTEDQKFRFRNSNLLYLTGTVDQDLGLIITKDEILVFRYSYPNTTWETLIEDEKSVAKRIGGSVINESEIWNLVRDCDVLFYDKLSACSHKYVEAVLNSQWSKSSGKPIRVALIDEILIPLRQVKSQGEIKIMQKAAEMAARIFNSFRKELSPELSELEIRNILYSHIYANQCEPSFEAIVACGENGAILHHTPGTKKWSKEEPLLIDFGIYYADYAIDVTRVLFIKPKPMVKEIYNLIKNINQEISSYLEPGKSYQQVQDKTISLINQGLQKILKSFKINEIFPHGWGHSIGLDVHDPSFLKTCKTETLKAGMVLTVEPGAYFKKNKYFNYGFGIRVEDCVVLNKNTVILTKSIPKDFNDMII